MTHANQLSVLRMVLVPFFVLLVLQRQVGGALAIFLAAGLTDALDGIIARRYGQKTPLGMVLDPMADKLLVTSAFVVLSLDGLDLLLQIPLWLTVPVIGRDVLLVLGAAALNLTLGRWRFPPSVYGKAATVCQLGTVLGVLAGNAWGRDLFVLAPWFYLTLALTVISGLHYLVQGAKILRAAPKGGGFVRGHHKEQ